MAKTKKLAGAKPISDVAQPGKSAPSGNSKSVIVSNRPLLKDPMVVAKDDTPAAGEDGLAKDAVSSTSKAGGQNKPDLQPLAAPILETESPDTPDTTASSNKADETTGKTPEQPKPTEPDKPADNADKPIAVEDKPTEPEPSTDASDDKANKDQTKPDDDDKSPDSPEATAKPSAKDNADKLEAEATAQAKHQAAIEKLADSKKYYLPINTVEKRRSRRFVVFGIILSLLLVVAWGDIALDAGLIQIQGLKPVTHFFSN